MDAEADDAVEEKNHRLGRTVVQFDRFSAPGFRRREFSSSSPKTKLMHCILFCMLLVGFAAIKADNPQWTLNALVRVISHLSPTCLPMPSGFSARMIACLSPTCPAVQDALRGLGRMLSHLFPTCLPVYSGFCPHDFRLVSRLSPVVSHLSPNTPWML